MAISYRFGVFIETYSDSYIFTSNMIITCLATNFKLVYLIKFILLHENIQTKTFSSHKGEMYPCIPILMHQILTKILFFKFELFGMFLIIRCLG